MNKFLLPANKPHFAESFICPTDQTYHVARVSGSAGSPSQSGSCHGDTNHLEVQPADSIKVSCFSTMLLAWAGCGVLASYCSHDGWHEEMLVWEKF